MIKEFNKEYAWLSNFEDVPIQLGEYTYPSVEHAYMSAKSEDPEWKEFCANPQNKAGIVKDLSRRVNLIPNWDTEKFGIMEECLRQKFFLEPYKTLLAETGDQHLQEGNWWGDKIWGVCLRTNEGENHLGKLIMKIRRT